MADSPEKDKKDAKKNGQEPAFIPTSGLYGWGATYGMSKREYFAAMALQGLLASECQMTNERFAEGAVNLADCLLLALEEEPSDG